MHALTQSAMFARGWISALHLQRAVLVAFRPRCLCLQPLHTAASSKFSICDDFLPWLRQKADHEITSSLSIGDSINGRYIFASKPIEAGECILRVPYSVHLTADKAIPGLGASAGDNASLSDIGLLAVALLAEKQLGWKSEWAPYITSLPLLEQMHNMVLWDEDDLKTIQLSSVYSETIKQKDALKTEFLVALNIFPQILHAWELKDFVHAYCLVRSRAWGTAKGISLIPFADFINHDGNSDSVLLRNVDKEISEVIADRDYSYGEEVLIRYGKFSNANLLIDFGFTLPYNVHDQVDIWLGVPLEDPLCSQKLELLHKHKMITTLKEDFQSSGISFSIKEVRSPKGTGKGIPQALRAFARVLCTSSSEDLKDLELEAATSDGRLARRPFKNKNQEIKAHRILLSHITHKMKDYNTTIKSLAAAVYSERNTTASVRTKMSMNLLTGELRVLKSACLWLKNYCDKLTS